ncbi:HEPN domain-containing protein [Acinetobacter sp. NIPH 817]|uniref:HEPN domain-containing protein n=1 Tax=Acinetobacter sp. NIPH 817 TaxID=520708 RepID=UPI0002D094E9|nr:HEPN domain-containing protein [Acinetobacter sp. NIPH 817]ENV03508.1 hypothetical protein F968_01162 [Acinetobacter sp. NIPH 817]
MTKDELEALSDLRLKESKTLFENELYQGAYYLCGYSIECALKACIAKSFKQNEFPNKRLVNDSYVHDLNQLLKLANLSIQFESDSRTDSQLEINWAIVKDWSEQFRYDPSIEKVSAEELINAVSDQQSGILPWIKKHW